MAALCFRSTATAGVATRSIGRRVSVNLPALLLLLLLVACDIGCGGAAQIKLTVSQCMECASSGINIQCDNVFRIHWGDNNLGSCADSQATFTDASYTALFRNTEINTPHGTTSNYQVINGNAGVDQLKSRIIAKDGSTYDCYRANGSTFRRKCAVQCTVGLSCYGPS